MAVNFTLAYGECVIKSSPFHFTSQGNNNVQLVWFKKYGKSQVLTLINCNWSAHQVVNQELNQVFLSSFSLITSYHIAHMMIQYRDWMSKIRRLLFHRREVRPQRLECSQARPDCLFSLSSHHYKSCTAETNGRIRPKTITLESVHYKRDKTRKRAENPCVRGFR
jgi:hypothetical protein